MWLNRDIISIRQSIPTTIGIAAVLGDLPDSYWDAISMGKADAQLHKYKYEVQKSKAVRESKENKWPH